MRLDLGGIAKGYAADAALTVLAQHGLPHAMVAAGGDLALGRPPPGEPGWKVALAPFGSAAGAPVSVVASEVGISTSGDAEQFVEIDGTRYSHILDPATGHGLTSAAAVTVIARTATLSDGLATAGCVLAARDPVRVAACAGTGTLVLVLRRDAQGRLLREQHGTPPPGLLPFL
jgi:thiamine biosynthesis lipoprotein